MSEQQEGSNTKVCGGDVQILESVNDEMLLDVRP